MSETTYSGKPSAWLAEVENSITTYLASKPEDTIEFNESDIKETMLPWIKEIPCVKNNSGLYTFSLDASFLYLIDKGVLEKISDDQYKLVEGKYLFNMIKQQI